MLSMTVLGEESFDDERQKFVYPNAVVLELEHSLVSLSKWESKYEKPFLTKDDKTLEEIIDYIRFMTLTSNVAPEVFEKLDQTNLDQIAEYLNAKQSATWFSETQPQAQSREIITSELIYYWMFSAQIPIDCESWNLNRLFTLLKVFGLKNAKPKPMNRHELASRNRALNAQRRAQLGSTG